MAGVSLRLLLIYRFLCRLYFQCKYSGVSLATLAIDPSANADPPSIVASGPLQVELRLGNGRCVAKGCAEGEKLVWILACSLTCQWFEQDLISPLCHPTDEVAYTSYYSAADYPVTKVLREPVYVEVHIVGRTDPNIVLVLGGCWATASPNPYSLPQWDLLVNG